MLLSHIFIFWVLGGGILSFFFRNKIAIYSASIRLPTFVVYLLIALLLVIIEEWFTSTAFPLSLLSTIPAFIIHLSVFYPLIHCTKLSETTLIILYGVWGSINEFIISGKLAIFAPQGLPVLLLMVVLNTLIYAVISIVPIAYATKTRP